MLPPSGFLPRLGEGSYRGNAVVFWTHTLAGRATGWLTPNFHGVFRKTLLHAAVRENLFCPVYTLMPDHVHLIWMGIADDSDQRLATKFLRTQLTSVLHPHTWQHQPHDRVLRDEQRTKKAFAQTCEYILENPVRAGLIGRSAEWAYSGCIIPGYPTLHPCDLDFWEKFWKFYESAMKRGTLGKTKSDKPAV